MILNGPVRGMKMARGKDRTDRGDKEERQRRKDIQREDRDVPHNTRRRWAGYQQSRHSDNIRGATRRRRSATSMIAKQPYHTAEGLRAIPSISTIALLFHQSQRDCKTQEEEGRRPGDSRENTYKTGVRVRAKSPLTTKVATC